jgi:hypothetical protein
MIILLSIIIYSIIFRGRKMLGGVAYRQKYGLISLYYTNSMMILLCYYYRYYVKTGT